MLSVYFVNILWIDYSPFGAVVHGRSYVGPTAYRYGFGTQEKDDEIYGAGNSYSAEFWQYDPRLGRRWNVDPIVKPWESSYAAFRNNPIFLSDPYGLDGEDPTCGNKPTASTPNPYENQKVLNLDPVATNTSAIADATYVFMRPIPQKTFYFQESYRKFIKLPSEEGLSGGAEVGIKDFKFGVDIGKEETNFKYGNKYIELSKGEEGLSSIEGFSIVKYNVKEKNVELKYKGFTAVDNTLTIPIWGPIGEQVNSWTVWEQEQPIIMRQFVPCTMYEFFAGKRPYKDVVVGAMPASWVTYKQVISVVSAGVIRAQREEIYRNGLKISDVYREGFNVGVEQDIKAFKFDAEFSTYGEWKPVPYKH